MKELKEFLRFMIKMTIITMASLFAAQAFSQEADRIYVDPRIEGYVLEYLDIMEQNGVIVPSQFQFMIGFDKRVRYKGAVGMAFGMFNPYSVMIALDPNILYLSHNQIRWVIFHELTHDLFDIRHESGLWLMRPVLPVYVAYYDVERGVCGVANYLTSKALFLKKPEKQDTRWQERRSLKEQLTTRGTGEASEQVKDVFRLSTSRILRNY